MIAKTEMLIRRPVAEVFEAFINPDITTKFWFTKSSGRLEAGKQIRWDWEMYNSGTDVNVKAIEPNKRILVEWMAYVWRTHNYRMEIHRQARQYNVCEYYKQWFSGNGRGDRGASHQLNGRIYLRARRTKGASRT